MLGVATTSRMELAEAIILILAIMIENSKGSKETLHGELEWELGKK